MSSDAYHQEIERWHAARIARLTAPNGWLSLVGLEWLQPGANRIGSAKDNDIVLAKAPARLGTITWAEDGTLSIVLGPNTGATVDGKTEMHALLLDDNHAAPTTIAFGSVNFIAVDRGGRKGLRVRDSAAETRTLPASNVFRSTPRGGSSRNGNRSIHLSSSPPAP